MYQEYTELSICVTYPKGEAHWVMRCPIVFPRHMG